MPFLYREISLAVEYQKKLEENLKPNKDKEKVKFYRVI